MVEVAIEILIPIILLGVFLIWFFWERITRWLGKKKYNPDNDKGKKGEEQRQELIRKGKPDPVRELTKTIRSSGRSAQPEKPGISLATASKPSGKTSTGSGKVGKLRDFLNRRRK